MHAQLCETQTQVAHLNGWKGAQTTEDHLPGAHADHAPRSKSKKEGGWRVVKPLIKPVYE